MPGATSGLVGMPPIVADTVRCGVQDVFHQITRKSLGILHLERFHAELKSCGYTTSIVEVGPPTTHTHTHTHTHIHTRTHTTTTTPVHAPFNPIVCACAE